ncbi:polyphosphate--glucose phosphotransferase [Fulvivirga lutea]|uniref:ROK family protein n=1 Tax=Fulvivirga lutea TaxID=2810512 RepID=A0A974WH78_9BACT|nr:ROK family protein [Fulvivirga lutea]QSE97067.1 ROK family protein [Fulvivirga lutea]
MNMLGIDVGGSGIKGAVVDTIEGKLISERYRIETPNPATPEAVSKVIKEIKDHFDWTDDIVCAFPTVVIEGKAVYDANLDNSWTGKNIEDIFSNACDDQHFEVINDADAAGIAEMRFGAGKHHSGLVMVLTFGTGIGSGVFYDGVLIPNFELGRILGKNGKVYEKFAADSARKREELEFDVWGKRVNQYLKHIERVFSPDFIIIGGGASKKIHKFRDQIKIKTRFTASEKLNNAGIIGAAVNAAEHHR